MDNRFYYVMGDLFSSVVAGVVAGWFSWLVVSTGWNMWVAMVVAMLLGMALALLVWFPLGLVWGAMEVMVPVMLAGMLGGMVLGMWCAMTALSPLAAAAIGGVCGLVSIVAVWMLNNSVRGIRTPSEGGHRA